MSKARINITLNQELHEKAKYWSSREQKSLSSVVEALLTDYCNQKNPPFTDRDNSPLLATDIERPLLSVAENLQLYHSNNPIMAITNAAEKLPVSKQMELLNFAEYLNLKESENNKISLRGIYPTGIWMSDDFDAPLEDFKEYMP